MATTRFDMRLDEDIKAKAEKASTLLGMNSLTEYVVKLLDADATQVIAQHESFTVEDNIFDQFMRACNKVNKPNKTLREAVAFTREKGFK